MKVSCIIPAYNEKDRIANVINIASASKLVDEIIVIDDGSTDNTKEAIVASERIKLISLEKNQGKSNAVARGIAESTGDLIFLLDADLVGLNDKNITDLIKSVTDGHADVAISLRGNTPGFWKFIGLDYISGERVFPKKILERHLGAISRLPGYGLEVFINSLIIKNKCRIKVVPWTNVESPYKHKKYGKWIGFKSDARMMRDIFRTITLFGPIYQIYKMLRQRVKQNEHHPSLKVSLVIPAYNEEKYIGECLEYAIRNSHDKLLEIIVVDNVSTDKTREIALGYPGVKVVREDRKGLTRARQCGYENAKGDILAYIDADTRMPEGWVHTIINEFEKNNNLATLSGPYVYYDISRWNQFLVKVLYWYIMAMPTYWIVGYMVTGANFAIRRSVLEKMKGFDTSIEFYGEDTNIARRARRFGKVKFDPSFPMYLSGRRLNHHGVYKTALLYISNFLSEVLRHRPVTSKYKDIR